MMNNKLDLDQILTQIDLILLNLIQNMFKALLYLILNNLKICNVKQMIIIYYNHI